MTALVQYAYEAFTGDTSSMDRLPAFIPVPGFDRRYYAQFYAGNNDGTAVSAWADRSGSGTFLTPAGSAIPGATAPVMGTVGQERVVRFNGATDALGQLYINEEPYTFTLAFYLPEAKPNAWLASVADVGQFGLFTNATSAVSFWGRGRAGAGTLSAGWHIITVRADGANTTIRVDNGAESTYTEGFTYTRRRLNIAGSAFNTTRARMDIVELVHWPRALSAGEIASVHTALADRYGI